MKSKELIKSLIADSRLAEVSGILKYEDTEKGNTNYELLDNMFGVTVKHNWHTERLYGLSLPVQ